MSDNFKKNICSVMKYYGVNDFIGGVFVKNVIDNIDDIENLASEINVNINDKEDFYLHLWSLSFKQMVKEINLYEIDDSMKNRIIALNKKIDYSPSHFINYVNNNYIIVFNKNGNNEVKWYEYFEILLELIYNKYSLSIQTAVFEYLEKNFTLDLLRHYNICKRYYHVKKDKLEYLFSNLKSTKVFDDEVYRKILLNEEKKDDFLKKQATFICERTLNFFDSVDLNSDDNKILNYDSYLSKYRKLAIAYKLKCANKFNELKKQIDLLVDEYTNKYGNELKVGPINLKTAYEVLCNDKNIAKFLILTHKNKDGEIINLCDEILNFKSKLSTEAIKQLNNPRSDKYPYYKQMQMEIELWIQNAILNYCIVDANLYNSFSSFIVSISKEVEEKFFNNIINISNEICGEVELLRNIYNLSDKKDEYIYKALLNGCCVNTCGTIEKILRNVALKEVKDDEYFDPSYSTLGQLLKHNFSYISKGLLYYIEFYLSKENNPNIDKENRPGKDLRNKHMHNQDDKYLSTTFNECYSIFYLLLSLLDDLFLQSRGIEKVKKISNLASLV